MIGAIIGDIAGSRFEFHNYRRKDFDFFSDKCFFTDDTVMTLAVAKAIKSCNGDYTNLSERAVKEMQVVGKRYPYCGYGGNFHQWIFSNNPKPYYSFGNGAAMRVSACGQYAKSLQQAKVISKKITEITHNHPEGLKGAESITVAIYLAKTGKNKQKIKDYIERNYYRLNFTIDKIRPTYQFNETCQDTVPQALEAFFESENFEDAIRLAISVGGDSDTLAAITGSIAEAYYGVPVDFEKKALSYLDKYLLEIYNETKI